MVCCRRRRALRISGAGAGGADRFAEVRRAAAAGDMAYSPPLHEAHARTLGQVLTRAFVVHVAQVRSAFVLSLVSVASISCSFDCGGEAAMRWRCLSPPHTRRALPRAVTWC